jgi:hypothetical protein
MSRPGEDFESPYYDWENGRLFDSATCELIDRIAHDPRFTRGQEGVAVADEWAAHLSEDRRRTIWNAAWGVFNATVYDDLSRRASELVRSALADPDLEALPKWDGEDPADDYFASRLGDPDPRLRTEIDYQLAASSEYQERQELARRAIEAQAKEIFQKLPRHVCDRLILASRNAQREELLAEWIGDTSSRRRSWLAYYVQRTARDSEEKFVLDRYAAAARILVGRGRSKKTVAQTLAIPSTRLDKLLERATGKDLADDDPLCTLAPELRGSGSEWRLVQSGADPARPKSLSRMSVDERVSLAAVTQDHSILMRLANQGSRRISEELINRFVRQGDVDEDVLRAVRDKYPAPWMHDELAAAHRIRSLPHDLALEIADWDPRVLMYGDDDIAARAAARTNGQFESFLAVRNSDFATMRRILASGPGSKTWTELVDLLAEYPLNTSDADALADELLKAADSAPDEEAGAKLRLIACQSDVALQKMIQANAAAGSVGVSPQSIVTAALGPYYRSGNAREVVLASARKLWAATDLTLEHGLARALVADQGSEFAIIETSENTYVASSDAIRCFVKSDAPTYTYVHLHLTAAIEHHFGDGVLRLPTSLPALPYQREMAINPAEPGALERLAIVWPLPLQPAIYSLDVQLGRSAGYFAVSDGRAAIVEDFGPPSIQQTAVITQPSHDDTAMLRAIPEVGQPCDDPSEDEILTLLHGIENGRGNFLIIERLTDPTRQTYAQIARNDDGTYVVEYRDGSADRHFGTVAADINIANELLTGWALGTDGWHARAEWSPVTF